MSRSAPEVFAVVGDTDWFDASSTLRHVDLGLDSRLRRIRRDFNSVNYRSAMSAGTRTVPHGGRFATLRIIAADAAGDVFGLVASGSETTTNYPGGFAGSVGMSSGGFIYHNGAAVQSGLATATVGDVLGLKLYRDGATLKVQFYKNAATFGTSITLTETSYRMMAVTYYVGSEYALSVDGDDPDVRAFLPADAQPWGAAARVADVGGYSPAASLISTYGANVGVDAYKRTARDVTGVDFSGHSARTDLGSRGTALLYIEFEHESGSQPIVGLCGASYSMTAAYVGFSGTDNLGYSGSTGEIIQNAGVLATYATYTTNDRPGFIVDPATGKVWVAKNGTVQAGNPEAGTGQVATLTGGQWYPAVTPFRANVRVRVCTHAREQLYRPSYATAWDGADILPEQHYRGSLNSNTEITTGIWFPFPWGGSKPGSPIGAIEIDAVDGYYDSVITSDIRDQSIALYQGTSPPSALARGVVEAVDLQGLDVLRVMARGIDARLDTRVNEPIVTIGGQFGLLPAQISDTAGLVYDVAATPYFTFATLYDQGLAITYGGASGWYYANTDKAFGFRRVANPAGKHAVTDITVGQYNATLTLNNSDFSAWTGDNPDGWTVNETSPSALITQVGSAARFLRNAGAAVASIAQAITTVTTGGSMTFLRIKVSAYVSGDLQIGIGGGPTRVGINGVGTYYWSSSAASATLLIEAIDSTDLTVDEVEAYHVTFPFSFAQVVPYLLQDLGGFAANEFEIEAGTVPDGIAYYSKDRPTIRTILSSYLKTILWDYYTSELGVLTFVEMAIPENGTSIASLVAGDLIDGLSVEDDLAPVLTDSMLYGINYEKYQESELAGSVTAAQRLVLMRDGIKSGTPATPALHPFYQHAIGAPSLRTFNSSTVELLTRIRDAYSVRRRFYTLSCAAEKVPAVTPGKIITVTMDRVGLRAGKKLLVVSVTRRVLSATVTLKLWG